MVANVVAAMRRFRPTAPLARCVAAALTVSLALLSPALPAQAAGCRFVLGFAALHNTIPFEVGGCLADQTSTANGDAIQPTTRGLLVWHEADNVTAFTDGFHTWLQGPEGLQLRLNSERFAWEADAGAPGAQIIPNTGSTPSAGAMVAVMTHTVEVPTPTEHFTPVGTPLTIADGTGGTLTAVIGTRYPTADGYGQLVFFWHGESFLGWDADDESVTVRSITATAVGSFTVAYAHYGSNEPLCCPTLPLVRVTYAWNGSDLTANGAPPVEGGHPVQVRLVPPA